MTKKKPSPQNRIWEKERRERLNKTFEDLQRLLPDHEPASSLSKVEILQRAIELISKLQKKIKVLVEECSDPLKEHVKEQEQRLKRLLVRNEELAGLLRKAKITVPPCKYTIAEEELQRQNEEKENGVREKKPAPKPRRATGTVPKKQPVIAKEPPASVASSEGLELSVVKSIAPPASGVHVSAPNSGIFLATGGATTLRHANGFGSGNGVNVTPALHPTPIMTTSVIISNNGNLVQVPIVAPPSSLLIVGNEDIRSKINLKTRPTDARYRGRRSKFTIKSIDLIPGRIVNGKIPIPPLRRSTSEAAKSSKTPRMKRKRMVEKCKRIRNKSSTPNTTKQNKNPDNPVAKRARLDESINEKLAPIDGEVQQRQVLETQPQSCANVSAISKSSSKEHQKIAPSNGPEPARDTQLDISLNQTDLPEDIFANLHVGVDGPNVHGNNDDGTLSPTAAYLMNFPIVAGGGKAAGNHTDAGEVDECHDSVPIEHQPLKSNITSTNEQTSGTVLDNFSSYFNYGHIDTTVGVGAVSTVGHEVANMHSISALSTRVPSTVTTTSSSVTATSSTTKENTFANYPTTYQSIDNMLDTRSVATSRPSASTTNTDYPGSVTFTFTLTSNTCTAPTTAQPAIGASHFYGASCGALNSMKAVDDFSSPLKPSIEFTFSLTSTTSSQPRNVQSQYTNSTMLATTMTTPSYETYGYFHKNVSKSSNYCASFNVLDPLLATEKPATSFTFSLTSSTKTEPSYAQSSIVTVSTNTTQAYGTPPKPATKQQHHHQSVTDSFPSKQDSPSKPDKVAQRTTNRGNASQATQANGMHQPQQQQIQSQQQQTQSKYDVSWMAAGVHNAQSSTVSSQSNQQQSHQPHQQQQSNFESVPSIEFPTTVGYTSTSNYKSDIFFAHPPGEEHNLTWSSPSKLSNILNDSSSPYFPPVTLPSLNGDLALNTSGGANTFGGASNKSTTSCKVATNQVKKSYTTHHGGSSIGTVQNEATATGSTFLSVSQLVNEPAKPYPNSNHNSNIGTSSGCPQKPVNNNYSAEALIGNSYTGHSSYPSVGLESGRKDKLFDYGSNALDNVPSTTGPLILNFDSFGNSSGMDYNKGYNFSNQQNGYVSSSYGESGYNGSSNCGGPSNTAPSTSIPYYGKTSASQGYYNQSNLEGTMVDNGSSSTTANYPTTSYPQSMATGVATGQDYAPYYLPSFGEKKQYPAISNSGSSSEQTTAKSKKSHKQNAEFVGNASVASTMPSTTMSSSSSSNYSYASNYPVIAASGSLEHSTSNHQMDSSSYPNYHHHHPRHNYHQQQQPSHQHQQHRQPSQQSSNATAESFSITSSGTSTRKPSSTTASSYNYSQYSSDKASQQSHHNAHHQPSYPATFSGHSHHLNLSSCINPSPAVSYANVQSTSSTYGQTTSSHQGHYYRQSSHHHHHHQNQHQLSAGTTSSNISTVSVANSSATAPSSTLTNFNLSTICPEINEKTGRSRDGRSAPGTVASAIGVSSSVPSIIAHW